MKRYFWKLNMKQIILLAVLLTGCAGGNQVPAAAFQYCAEIGGTPEYFSDANRTTFKCTKPTNK